jgi:8-oxo-dGTP pyrophosphatase MutT (NUDIX family)
MGEAAAMAGKSPTARALRPRDAATLIIVDRTGSEPRVLMGRRRADLVFLPNLYVFPGGRVDGADRRVASADELNPDETRRLLIEMKGRASAARARGLAMAAIREAFEETGVVIGAAAPGATTPAQPWSEFFSEGYAPRPGALTYFARAITPPGRPRRYDTRFFVADVAAVAARLERRDGELSSVDWFTFAEMRALELPRITRVVVDDLDARLHHHERRDGDQPIPFYFFHAGSYRRKLLALRPSGSAAAT